MKSLELPTPVDQDLDAAELKAQAEQDDATITELTGGTFKHLSPEEQAIVADWGAEAQAAHQLAQEAGRTAINATETGVEPGHEQVEGYVDYGNTTMSAQALHDMEQSGQDMNPGTYEKGQR